ncbi:MAG: hypothetical protein JJ850_07395 [Kordiimonadaceae bacterium]|nr:hypothetical protein [Kordiimonadaceae bacterium]MBO6964425.1 hypothetical protein [Kordiimonadaceae bacterium]
MAGMIENQELNPSALVVPEFAHVLNASGEELFLFGRKALEILRSQYW